MKMKRVCPACGHENEEECLVCSWCLGDLANVPPGSGLDRSDPLLMLSFSGLSLEVRHGDVIGRSALGKELFDGHAGVSRKHLLVVFVDGAWFIEDLGSTNGTKVNGERIESGTKHRINAGDSLALSKNVTLVVL